jgi:pimeloyl-ACP methyl ester carboxylesterase
LASDYDPRLSIEGDGPAVVLVPGMNGSGDLFYCQVPRLQRSFRVATYCLRDAAEDVERLAADLARIVDAVSPATHRAIVVGESFGGAVALTFALRYPDRVDALVILNSFAYFSPQIRLRLAIAGLAILPWGAMPLVRRLTAFRLHSPHTHHAEVKRFLELTAGASRAGYVNRLKLLRRFDLRDRLREIRAPTLFLASDHDHLVPAVAQARYMTERVPQSVMRVLKGHGHICLIAPDLDLREILNEWRPDLPARE